MRTIYPYSEKMHECDIGRPEIVPEGTLRQCDCGLWYYRGETYVGFGSTEVWYEVRWWQLRRKSRIRGYYG